MLSDFYKHNESDTIWWVDDLDHVGRVFFSFDKKKIYNMFSDYPDKLSKNEIEIFKRENQYWSDYFEAKAV